MTPVAAPRSSYAHLIGPSPDCKPGDRDGAKIYLRKIRAAIDQGGWGPSERTRLYRLQHKWLLRAQGRDARYEIAGTRPGRLDAETEARIRMRNEEIQAEIRTRKRKQRAIDWEKWAELEGDSPDRSAVDEDETTRAFLGDSAPTRPARGGPDTVGVDPDHGADDDSDEEAGEKKADILITDVFRVPGQDNQGHSQRIGCRVMPIHFRALSGIVNERKFPFKTLGDAMRWCVVDGIRRLGKMTQNVRIMGVVHQADSIMQLLNDEQFQLDYQQVFNTMQDVVNRHLANGAEGEARRVVAVIRREIEQMPEGYWRTRYLKELSSKFGHLLRGQGVALGD